MITAILLAAGSSRRMGENKLLMNIGGRTPLELSYTALANSQVDSIIIAVSEQTYAAASRLKSHKPTRLVMGGDTRSRSVLNGLSACDSECSIVAIHDAARCLVTPEIINESVELAKKYGSGIATTAIRDTVRSAGENSRIDRDSYLLMQTPQTFRYEKILAAYNQNPCKESNTDDCEYYILAGNTPHYFEAGFTNQKLTYQYDMEFFSAILKEREGQTMNSIRVGIGEDTHRFSENRALILGGVTIPYHMGMLGHSDADVVCHAICDALLGAVALGDIGKHFPDTDIRYKGANSLELLKQVVEKCKTAGYGVGNVDATITAQEPKLKPYIDEMRYNLSVAMGIPTSCVSVKATTPEHTNAEGRLECITVRSVAVVHRL